MSEPKDLPDPNDACHNQAMERVTLSVIKADVGVPGPLFAGVPVLLGLAVWLHARRRAAESRERPPRSGRVELPPQRA